MTCKLEADTISYTCTQIKMTLSKSIVEKCMISDMLDVRQREEKTVELLTLIFLPNKFQWFSFMVLCFETRYLYLNNLETQ